MPKFTSRRQLAHDSRSPLRVRPKTVEDGNRRSLHAAVRRPDGDSPFRGALLNMIERCASSMMGEHNKDASLSQIMHLALATVRLTHLAQSTTAPLVCTTQDLDAATSLLDLASEAAASTLSTPAPPTSSPPPQSRAGGRGAGGGLNAFQQLCQKGLSAYFSESKHARFTFVATPNYYYAGKDGEDPFFVGRVINSNEDCLLLRLYDVDWATLVCQPSHYSLHAARRSVFHVPNQVSGNARKMMATPYEVLSRAMPKSELDRALASCVAYKPPTSEH
jgi:hypothetical protein